MGEGRVGKVQWMQRACDFFSCFPSGLPHLSLSPSLSSSLTTTKKNACTLHVRLNFFVFSSGKYERLLMKNFHLEMVF